MKIFTWINTGFIWVSLILHILHSFLDADISKFDSRLMQVLAWQRLQQLKSEAPLPSESEPTLNLNTTTPQPKKGLINNLLAPNCENRLYISTYKYKYHFKVSASN